MKEFISCQACGKIVNARSAKCHRCGAVILRESQERENSSTEQFAEGGYDSETEEFDYEEFVESEFGAGTVPKRTLWYYVAWLMIAVMLLPILISLFFYASL